MAKDHSEQYVTAACSSGKIGYVGRRDAKMAAKRLLRTRGRMSSYECVECGWWHIGHLAARVRTGDISRSVRSEQKGS